MGLSLSLPLVPCELVSKASDPPRNYLLHEIKLVLHFFFVLFFSVFLFVIVILFYCIIIFFSLEHVKLPSLGPDVDLFKKHVTSECMPLARGIEKIKYTKSKLIIGNLVVYVYKGIQFSLGLGRGERLQ